MEKIVKYLGLALALSLLFTFTGIRPCAAMTQEPPEEPDLMEMAETEADRLTSLLDLEVWQTFYVDSTLKFNYPAMQEELTSLQKSKVSNYSMYLAIQDKWMEKIDSSYMKIFNQEQWNAYLKSGAAKQQKMREKRKEQAAKKISSKK